MASSSSFPPEVTHTTSAPLVIAFSNASKVSSVFPEKEEQITKSTNSKVDGEKFLAENRNNDGVIVLASGLQYKIVEEGSGKVPDYDDRVTVHYHAYLIDGHKFDSSYDKGQPLTLEVSRFVPGFQEALLMMPVGSRWEVYIPYNLAYGEQGIKGSKLEEYVVPPSSTLIFEMELLDITQ